MLLTALHGWVIYPRGASRVGNLREQMLVIVVGNGFSVNFLLTMPTCEHKPGL